MLGQHVDRHQWREEHGNELEEDVLDSHIGSVPLALFAPVSHFKDIFGIHKGVPEEEQMCEQNAKDHEHNLKNHKYELEGESRSNHKELKAVGRISRAALGLGHVLQSSVEYVQVDDVLDLLKVEEGGLGTNR